MLSFYLCLFIIGYFGAQGSLVRSAKCGPDRFSCSNGECIDKNQWCDSVKDCADGSDEQYCRRKKNEKDSNPNMCPLSLFKCKNGRCIPMNGRCDGFNSCEDSSDEHDCFRKNRIHTKTEELFEMTRSSLHQFPSANYTIGVQGSDPNVEYVDELDTIDYIDEKEEARKWLVSQRRKDYGWGDDTERAIVALSLSGDDFRESTPENMLMVKQLHVKLSVDLARNQTEMADSDLALYINALQASCSNPKNFHGFDLVSELRKRVNDNHYDGRFSMPSVYLTLCLNNASTEHDMKILQDLHTNRDRFVNKNDIQALILLATICMRRSSSDRLSGLVPLQEGLVRRIGGNLSGNVYEVALIIQAFSEARVNPDKWTLQEALQFVLNHQDENGSFGDLLATYYVLPILSGKSLLSLGNQCDESDSDDLKPLEVLKNTKKQIYVNYAIYLGSPMEMSQTMFLYVSEGTTFYDIMRLAQEKNSNYRFSLDEKKDVPTVYSIGGIPNDAERGVYWVLYLRPTSRNNVTQSNLLPMDHDLMKLVPRGGENIIFWRKRI